MMDINLVYVVKFTERGLEITYDDETFDRVYEQLVISTSNKIAAVLNDQLKEIPNDGFCIECKINTDTHAITCCNIDMANLTKNKLH